MPTHRNTPKELDSDKVRLINVFLPQLPDYFKKTDEMYKILITGEGLDDPSGISIIRETKKKVDELFDLGNLVVKSVIGVIVSLAIGGIIFLIRYAPILAELEHIAKSQP